MHKKLLTPALALATFALPLLHTGSAAAWCNKVQIRQVQELDDNNYCQGNYAFLIEGVANWICAANELQSRLVLAAMLASKPITFELGGPDNDCDPDSHYNYAKRPSQLIVDR